MGTTADMCGTEPQDIVLREMLERIGDKWTLLVIRELSGAVRRFSEIERAIPGISHRMLARTLKMLERDGLVSRTAYAEVPPRVEYALTALGDELMTPVRGLIGAVADRADRMAAHRAAYDARA